MNHSVIGTHLDISYTYHFFFGAQHTQLAEAHMEWRALVSAVSLADNHNIDASRQRGLINALVQFFNGYQHLTCQLAHVVHGVRLVGEKTNISEVKREDMMKAFGSALRLFWTL